MDDEVDLDSTGDRTPGARDFRTMSEAAFALGRRLDPEERAALARRPRFHSMPWLRLLTNEETQPTDPDDLLP